MKVCKYVRSGKTLRSTARGENNEPEWQKTLGSRNAAKRESRRLQINEDGALGLGSVRAEPAKGSAA